MAFSAIADFKGQNVNLPAMFKNFKNGQALALGPIWNIYKGWMIEITFKGLTI